MSFALEMRRVAKRFIAGTNGCLATCNVLRGVDLALRRGEGLAIVAPRGAGKSTLLLCAAGLMAPDAGEISWFGERARGASLEQACYYCSLADLAIAARGRARTARVHLVDLAEPLEPPVSWLLDRLDDGDAVVVAAETERIADSLGVCAIALRFGRLVVPVADAVRSRVAEHAPFC